MKREIVQMALDWFKPKNIRKHFDPGYLDRLGNSMLVRIWHPVLAMPDGILVDGEGRLRAAKLKGIESLPTIILDGPLTQTELRLAQGQTAIHRAELTAWEEYQLCSELLGLNTNWGLKELAEHLNIDPAIVTKIMSASKTIPDVREALKAGKLGRSHVYEISKAPEAEQPDLLQAKLTGSIGNREALHAEVKARKKSVTNGHKVGVNRLSAPLPSGHVFSIVGPMGCVSDLREEFRAAMKLADKAIKDGIEDLKTFQAWLRAKDK